MSGTQLIARERRRQVRVEKYFPRHDDGHTDCSLAIAAACYAAPVPIFYCEHGLNRVVFLDPWPWPAEDKRERWIDGKLKAPDALTTKRRIRDLVKAGALIAAEIDRLQRAARRRKAKP